MERCIYCNHSHLYLLATKQLKCARCKRKFSPAKIERERIIKECFCKNFSISSCKAYSQLSYETIKKGYFSLRKKIALFMEEEFRNRKETIAFEEYLYLEKSKRKSKKNIFDAYNFLTFNYDGKIYNLLLPNLNRYKPLFLEDGLEEVYYKEFEKFLRRSHLGTNPNKTILEFWDFFEEFILKFKGVRRENFFYYLKEAEFKFNFECFQKCNFLSHLLIYKKSL